MKQSSMPTFIELSQLLDKTALKLHASQVHGLICGVYCGDSKSTAAWEDLVKDDETGRAHEILQTLYNQSVKQLDDFLFEFQLILPADSSELPLRAEALTLWCQGFLTGLKLGNVKIVGREPGEMTEAINDLIEIAKMNYEEVIETEEDEAAYVELVEYVRMAAIFIFQTLREEQAPPSSKTSDRLH